MSKLQRFSQQQLPLVEKTMTGFITAETTDDKLAQSMLYSLQAGGKRIRPLSVLATAASFDKKIDQGCYQVAAAIEMLHTYSLIHDDLPAMDDDDLRRGEPTNHIVYGEALAILAGDGLLTEAFHLVSVAEIEAEKKILLLQALAGFSGSRGMVAGQAADMQAEGKAITLSELMAIHQRKTGDLITCSFLSGGILADQPEAVLNIITQFSRHLGLAFQIRDDLLDVVGTTAELGKTVHRDEALVKSTYPALLGLAGAKAALEAELTAATACLGRLEKVEKFSAELLTEFSEQFRLGKEGNR